MTPDEYRQRLDRVVNAMQTEHIVLMQQLGVNAMALIKNRIQNSGRNAEGGSFTPDYTAKYKKAKQKSGKYKGFVDFSFTNRMWTNVQIKQTTPKSTTIGALSDENRKKMEYNVEKRGTILDLSEREINQVMAAYEKDLIALIHKNGL